MQQETRTDYVVILGEWVPLDAAVDALCELIDETDNGILARPIIHKGMLNLAISTQ